MFPTSALILTCRSFSFKFLNRFGIAFKCFLNLSNYAGTRPFLLQPDYPACSAREEPNAVPVNTGALLNEKAATRENA